MWCVLFNHLDPCKVLIWLGKLNGVWWFSGQKIQVLLRKGKCLHMSVAVKRDHCCAALKHSFEPCGFDFAELTPVVYQIYLSSADLTDVEPWMVSVQDSATVEIQECNCSTVQLSLL